MLPPEYRTGTRGSFPPEVKPVPREKRSVSIRLGEPYNICAHGAVDTHSAYCQDNERLQQGGDQLPTTFPWDPTVRIVSVVGVGLVTATTPQAGSWRPTTTACGTVAIFAQILFVDKPLHNGTQNTNVSKPILLTFILVGGC